MPIVVAHDSLWDHLLPGLAGVAEGMVDKQKSAKDEAFRQSQLELDTRRLDAGLADAQSDRENRSQRTELERQGLELRGRELDLQTKDREDRTAIARQTADSAEGLRKAQEDQRRQEIEATKIALAEFDATTKDKPWGLPKMMARAAIAQGKQPDPVVLRMMGYETPAAPANARGASKGAAGGRAVAGSEGERSVQNVLRGGSPGILRSWLTEVTRPAGASSTTPLAPTERAIMTRGMVLSEATSPQTPTSQLRKMAEMVQPLAVSDPELYQTVKRALDTRRAENRIVFDTTIEPLLDDLDARVSAAAGAKGWDAATQARNHAAQLKELLQAHGLDVDDWRDYETVRAAAHNDQLNELGSQYAAAQGQAIQEADNRDLAGYVKGSPAKNQAEADALAGKVNGAADALKTYTSKKTPGEKLQNIRQMMGKPAGPAGPAPSPKKASKEKPADWTRQYGRFGGG